VIEAVDADKDGMIGLDDFLWFAACCKEVFMDMETEANDSKIKEDDEDDLGDEDEKVEVIVPLI